MPVFNFENFISTAINGEDKLKNVYHRKILIEKTKKHSSQEIIDMIGIIINHFRT